MSLQKFPKICEDLATKIGEQGTKLARASSLQSVTVQGSTGNDDSGPLFPSLFSSSFLFFSVATFSHRTALRMKKCL